MKRLYNLLGEAKKQRTRENIARMGFKQLNNVAIGNWKIRNFPKSEFDKYYEAGLQELKTKKRIVKKVKTSKTNKDEWRYPPINLLANRISRADAGDVKGNAAIIEETLLKYEINVELNGANIGPSITQYYMTPIAGTMLSEITKLEEPLCRALSASSIRIEAPIPGQKYVGVEVPNLKTSHVSLAGLLKRDEWKNRDKKKLNIMLGADTAGSATVCDLEKFPNILMAGQTGSGKSIMINDLLASLLLGKKPEDLKLILIDPKQVELSLYKDIPHLLTPIITTPEKCVSALRWAEKEVDRRLKTLSETRDRNITKYNARGRDIPLPHVVIVIDELADIMMMYPEETEEAISNITSKSTTVGIHIILATSRPSRDIFTDTIRESIPSRIAFATASQIDSYTILDEAGAEKLIGKGDMLVRSKVFTNIIRRLQAPHIDDDDIESLTSFLRDQASPKYDNEVIHQSVELTSKGTGGVDTDPVHATNPEFKRAVEVVIEAGKASTSLLQRRLRIGYGKAARLIESMEEQGIVGPADGSRPREVLINDIKDAFTDD